MNASQLDFIPGESLCKVSLEEAQASIAYYKRILRDDIGFPEEDILKAFAVRHDDIFECLGIPDSTVCEYQYFRVYLGMRVPDANEGASDMRLFLCPVVNDEAGNGIDVIPTCPPSKEFPSGRYVYDFNTPCPNTCDISSPLFKA